MALPALAGRGRGLGARPDPESPARNVLLVFVDDLRAELGCYGSTRVHTPNIDRLASGGLTFLRCYCQQAASGPSRTSLLTGLRPDTTRVYDDRTHFRRAAPGAITLPEHFRRHGYETTAFGRVFGPSSLDDRPSWHIAPWTPGGPPWRSAERNDLAASNWNRLQQNGWRIAAADATAAEARGPGPNSVKHGRSWGASEGNDADLRDGQTARAAAAAIDALRERRFFVAVGFRRPHLPLFAPQRYFSRYPKGTWGAPESPLRSRCKDPKRSEATRTSRRKGQFPTRRHGS